MAWQLINKWKCSEWHINSIKRIQPPKCNEEGYAIKEIQFRQYVDYEIIYNPGCVRWLREANNKFFLLMEN